ncbi:hypothetical protein G6O67_007450 [Ophiocordyceps sinensis]|uniref:Uncharacterized protein n=1 Tax=Ophiocordyceps sinensis TaxID=72228 RepID=A0A8H4PL24_9HYPO|nr:hypothetical protein G6O67_007450 [Ophiocordyceps sinensis]
MAELAHRLGLEVAPPQVRQGGLGVCGADGIPEVRLLTNRIAMPPSSACQEESNGRGIQQPPSDSRTCIGRRTRRPFEEVVLDPSPVPRL